MPHSISPKTRAIPSQCLTEMAGVFTAFEAIVQPIKDAFLDLSVQLAQLPFGNVADFNGPAQDPA